MFSGGLDSLLAARLLKELGIEILLLNFRLPFSGRLGNESPDYPPSALKSRAPELGCRLIVEDLGQDYIEMLRNPKHGYGKAANPCIDCKVHMLSKARGLMNRYDVSFVATGEVLGQRPMSQRRDAMRIIERDSGLDGLLLRPLTAKNLKPTLVEENRWVDREQLLDFRGRSRKPQLELAARFKINDPPGSAGGCLLTESAYAKRLVARFEAGRPMTHAQMHILKYGRHFKTRDGAFIVVSRKEQENDALKRLAVLSFNPVVTPEGWPGPLVLLEPQPSDGSLEFAGRAAARYGKPPLKNITFRLEIPGNGPPAFFEVDRPATNEELEATII